MADDTTPDAPDDLEADGQAAYSEAGAPKGFLRRHPLRWSAGAVFVLLVAGAGAFAYKQVNPTVSDAYSHPGDKVPTAPHLTPQPGETVYRIDPTRSSLTYGVDESIVGQKAGHAEGTTQGIAGDIAVNPDQPGSARVGTIVVNVEQLHSDNRLRDARIRDDFLESHEHPLVTFTSGTISGLPAKITEGKSYPFTMKGTLKVNGTPAPVAWKGTAKLAAGTLTANAATTVKMSSFGVGPINLVGLVRTSDDVDLTMKLTAADAKNFVAPTEVALASAPAVSGGQSPSYKADIEPVLAASCASCHTEGQVGAEHWQLDTAGDASKVAEGIGTVVRSGYMPPWPASTVGVPLAHSKALDAKTIDTLSAWAAAGGPLDVPASTPIKPTAPAPGTQPRKDIVMKMPQAYTGDPSNNSNDYRCFLLDPKLTEPTFITGYEVTPGQRKEIHHAQIFHVNAEAAERGATRTEDDGQPGWSCYGGAGLGRELGNNGLIAGWVPGQDPVVYPDNSGVLMQPGDQLVLQLHYHYEDEATPDQSTVSIQTEPGTSDVKELDVVNPLGPVEMPCDPGVDNPLCDRTAALQQAGKDYGLVGQFAESTLLSACGKTKEELAARYKDGIAHTDCTSTVPMDGTIVSAMGHMHTLGKDFRLTLDPDTPQEKILLDIPRWNFDWQMNYGFQKPLHVKKGQKIRMDCRWDRAADPLRKQKYIVFAEGTEDEMCFSTYSIIPDVQPDR